VNTARVFFELQVRRWAQQPSDALLKRLAEHTLKTSRFKLHGEIARGGMGAIMKVFDEDLRCNLAMKVILGKTEEAASGGTPADSSSQQVGPAPSQGEEAGDSIPKRGRAVTDWDQALRLRKQGMGMKDIAARLGVSYPTIQVGLFQRLGPAVAPRAPKSHDRRRLYQIWRSLRLRTTDPSNRQYRANGALGVRVCREWKEFEAFLAWA